jgi:hypothetical protein
MPPAVRAVYLIREGESLLFPVPADQFPVRAKTIPCSLFGRKPFPVLICREFVCKTLKLIYDLMTKIAKSLKKTQIPWLFSLF